VIFLFVRTLETIVILTLNLLAENWSLVVLLFIIFGVSLNVCIARLSSFIFKTLLLLLTLDSLLLFEAEAILKLIFHFLQNVCDIFFLTRVAAHVELEVWILIAVFYCLVEGLKLIK